MGMTFGSIIRTFCLIFPQAWASYSLRRYPSLDSFLKDSISCQPLSVYLVLGELVVVLDLFVTSLGVVGIMNICSGEGTNWCLLSSLVVGCRPDLVFQAWMGGILVGG